jgi:hypothetical protein
MTLMNVTTPKQATLVNANYVNANAYYTRNFDEGLYHLEVIQVKVVDPVLVLDD